jgi:3,4-dihydroxy 2-butanone 4-phosphate synthase/GTP cyclohydrolase II
MPAPRLQALDLPQMVTHNADPFRTAFTVSVDYKYGTTSGISAADRALTLRKLADPSSQADDFHRPGHIFPLRARRGGVLERPGHTEAAHDLAAMAGLQPVGVLCEIVNDDGSMARRPDLFKFASVHGLKIISIADMKAYRARDLNYALPGLQAIPRQQSRLLDAAMVYGG